MKPAPRGVLNLMPINYHSSCFFGFFRWSWLPGAIFPALPGVAFDFDADGNGRALRLREDTSADMELPCCPLFSPAAAAGPLSPACRPAPPLPAGDEAASPFSSACKLRSRSSDCSLRRFLCSPSNARMPGVGLKDATVGSRPNRASLPSSTFANRASFTSTEKPDTSENAPTPPAEAVFALPAPFFLFAATSAPPAAAG
mmetsp:Transcript_14393/g.28746  ORF Transcript_14393/g.28746 Transcript_14393/m.28746 type:complete len:200 (-) Transcript_14393:908-1507(-)